eukprot:1161821-Pelagomonas_calceolata.AAC.18
METSPRSQNIGRQFPDLERTLSNICTWMSTTARKEMDTKQRHPMPSSAPPAPSVSPARHAME